MQQGGGSPFNDSPTTADPALRTGSVGVCYVAAQPKATKQQTSEGTAAYGRGSLKHFVSPRDWAQLDQRKSQHPKVHNDAKEARGNSQWRVTIDSQSER